MSTLLLTSTTSASACLPWLATKLARLRRHGSAALFATATFDESTPGTSASETDSVSVSEDTLSSPPLSHSRHLRASDLRCAASAPASLFRFCFVKMRRGVDFQQRGALHSMYTSIYQFFKSPESRQKQHDGLLRADGPLSTGRHACAEMCVLALCLWKLQAAQLWPRRSKKTVITKVVL